MRCPARRSEFDPVCLSASCSPSGLSPFDSSGLLFFSSFFSPSFFSEDLFSSFDFSLFSPLSAVFSSEGLFPVLSEFPPPPVLPVFSEPSLSDVPSGFGSGCGSGSGSGCGSGSGSGSGCGSGSGSGSGSGCGSSTGATSVFVTPPDEFSAEYTTCGHTVVSESMAETITIPALLSNSFFFIKQFGRTCLTASNNLFLPSLPLLSLKNNWLLYV